MPIPARVATLGELDGYLQSLVDAGAVPRDVRAWVVVWAPADPDAIAIVSDFGALTGP